MQENKKLFHNLMYYENYDTGEAAILHGKNSLYFEIRTTLSVLKTLY